MSAKETLFPSTTKSPHGITVNKSLMKNEKMIEPETPKKKGESAAITMAKLAV